MHICQKKRSWKVLEFARFCDGKRNFLRANFVEYEGEEMGVIHCCGGLRRTKSYILQPENGFLQVRLDWLESCSVCSHTVLQLTRLDYKNEISVIRKTNSKARKFREKLEPSIISEITKSQCIQPSSGSSFYLFYNDFGKKKKCFSNLSTLKMGISENLDLKTNKILNLCPNFL